MKIIEPSFVALTDFSAKEMSKALQFNNVVTTGSIPRKITVRDLVVNHYETVLRRFNVSVILSCDKGIADELVKQGWANPKHQPKGKSQEVEFIRPFFL